MRFISLDLYSKMVLNPFYSIAIDLEMPRDSCMHLTRSKASKRSNPRFLTVWSCDAKSGCMIETLEL